MPEKKKKTTTKKRTSATVKKTTKTAKKPAAKKAPAKRVTASNELVVKRKRRVRRSYSYAVGKRKSAVARVRWYHEGKGEIIVNEKPYDEYFTQVLLQSQVKRPLVLVGKDGVGKLTIKVHGGGLRGQSEAVRHGVSKVLALVFPEVRLTLKKEGFIRRDARVKERKKFGLKGARRAPQWAKR